MRNKEITVFGLLILVKDNNAPEKITYNGEVWEFNKDTKDYRNLIGNRLFSIYKTEVILNHKVKILDEENDEFEDIEIMTLKGKEVGFGIMNEWLDFTPNDNEQKICSAIEALGIEFNKLIRNQKKIIERSKKDE